MVGVSGGRIQLQLLSDLHLETEAYEPEPAPGADFLVLAGDIDSTWAGYRRFAGWPVPVLVVLGNHEFDGRDMHAALDGLRELCTGLGFTLLEKQSVILGSKALESMVLESVVHKSALPASAADVPTAAPPTRVRVLGTTRWSDFNTFGPAGRARAERAAAYYLRLMGSQRGGRPLDAAAVRELGLADRQWLETELGRTATGATGAELSWHKTLVITHFAPSLRSADPRFGHQPGTASFCNADDDLIPRADLWLHGHLHCRHDYTVPRAGRAPSRVVCNARGLARKGEHEANASQLAHQPQRLFVV